MINATPYRRVAEELRKFIEDLLGSVRRNAVDALRRLSPVLGISRR